MKRLTLEITSFCNEKCIHCYHPQSRNQTNLLDLDLLDRLLFEFAEKGFLDLLITGGEALLNPKFKEICLLARKHRYLVGIKTNGLLLDDDMAAFLKEFKPRRVDVSVYSADAKEHDSVTQVEGSFERSFNALKLLVKNRVRAYAVTPAMKGLKRWKEVPEIMLPLGINWQCWHTIFSSFDARTKVEDLKGDEEFYYDFLKFTTTLDDKYKEPHEGMGLKFCNGTVGQAAIGADLSIRPCISYPESAGMYDGTNLDELLQKGHEMLLARHKDMECHHCELTKYCPICPGQLRYVDGKLVCDPTKKEYVKAYKKFFDLD